MHALTEYFSFFVDIPNGCDFCAIDKYFSSMSDGEKIAYEDACL